MDRPVETIPFHDLLLTQKDMARDQLAAAWQLHVAQVEEQLRKGWKEHLSRVFEERFRALSEGMEDEFQKRLSLRQAEVRAISLAEAEKARLQARQAMAESLNQGIRRFSQAESANEWISALLDAVQAYTLSSSLFSTLGGKLRLEGQRPSITEGKDLELKLKDVPAFGAVADTKDTVVCAATPGELPEPIYSLTAGEGIKKIYLFPVLATDQTLVGILTADADPNSFDLNAVELLCTMAGAARRTAAPRPGLLAGINPLSAGQPAPPPMEDERHEPARRLARVKIAEIRLYQSQPVVEGRTARDLYARLKTEIDAARKQYQEQYSGLPDYLHEEIVRTLANNDPSLLGADYPGPLV